MRGVGPTLAQAFEQAALALTAVVTDLAGVDAREAVDVACDAADRELLLAQWLNALVYEMAVRRVLFAHFEVAIDDGPPARLRARAFGEPVDVVRHRPAVEVKGATHTALRVEHTADGGWLAQTVVDV